MNERPIILSPKMINAILESRKKQTRRLQGLEVINKNPDQWVLYETNNATCCFYNKVTKENFVKKCPYGQAGDKLWVRETYMKTPEAYANGKPNYFYKADSTNEFIKEWKGNWRSSIYMPKSASRLWLEVDEVRVERLQDITAVDARAEGIDIPMYRGTPLFDLTKEISAFDFLPKQCMLKEVPFTTEELYVAFYAVLWSNINGIENWYENPWVWVVDFRVISRTRKLKEQKELV